MPKSPNSVGEIGLDLTVKGQDSLRKQIDKTATQGTQSLKKLETGFAATAKKIGAALAGAFALKKLIQFGRESVAAANAQTEAETKLTTVMAQRMHATNDMINSIKKLASAQQAIGVIGDEVQLAGAQQLSTFLNSTQALKTLIPAMNNLAAQQKGAAATSGDLVTIGNLMGKVMQGQTTALKRVGISFSAAEEQALKYGNEEERAAMLAQVVTNNVGNMNAALANTPAGKIAQIKNAFGDLKEEIGYGLLNALTPILDVISRIIQRLAQLATAFRQFTAKIFGDSSQANAAAAGIGTITDAADEATESTEGIGAAAKKAAKDLRQLMGFDKINKLTAPEEEAESDTDTGTGAAGAGLGDMGLSPSLDTADKLGSKFDGLIDQIKTAGRLFKSGFLRGLGDARPKLESIKKSAENIKKTLADIAADPRVQGAAEKLAKSYSYNLGRVAGGMARVGLNIGNNLISGVAQYLEGSQEYITERIVGIFDGASKHIGIVGNVAKAFGLATEWLNSDGAITLTASIIGIFSDAFLGVLELGVKFGADIYDLLTRPFVDNAAQISQVIEDALGPVSECFATIHETIRGFFDDIIAVYDETISPFIDKLAGDWSDLAGTFLDCWTTYFQPVLENLAEKFTQVWEDHIQPVFDKFRPLIEEAVQLIDNIWTIVLKPFLEWCEKTIMPVLAPIFEGIGSAVLDVFGVIGDVVGMILDVLTGLLEFVNDVFEGNWDKAWEDIKNTFADAWESIKSIGTGAVNAVISIINGLLDAVETMAGGIATALNGLSIDMPSWLQDLTGYSSIGFNIPQPYLPRIPYLAQGGYVRANTPRLAMIGDNRHEGEIVAPEGKLREIMEAAVKAAGGSGGVSRDELENILNRVMLRLIAGMSQIGVYLDKAEVGRIIGDEIDKNKARYGLA